MEKSFLSHISDKDAISKLSQYIIIQMQMLREQQEENKRLRRLLHLRRKYQNVLGIIGTRDFVEVNDYDEDEKLYASFFTLFCDPDKEIVEFLGLEVEGEYDQLIRVALNKKEDGMAARLEYMVINIEPDGHPDPECLVTEKVLLTEERMFDFLERFVPTTIFMFNDEEIDFHLETVAV